MMKDEGSPTIQQLLDQTVLGLRRREGHLRSTLSQVNRRDAFHRKNLKEKINAASRALSNFREILDHLDPYFDLRIAPYAVDREVVRTLREEFGATSKPEFLKAVAGDNVPQLQEMGMKEEEIAFMRKTGFVPYRPLQTTDGADPPKLDITADHNLDLSCGGGNDPDNLFVVPHHINQLRNIWKDIQKLVRPGHADILLLEYRKGQYLHPVPVFRSGFQLEDRSSHTVARRIKADLGIDLRL